MKIYKFHIESRVNILYENYFVRPFNTKIEEGGVIGTIKFTLQHSYFIFVQ